MANQGLRKCIQQKQVNIGGATAYINTYSADANFILSLPIFSTVGFAPIDLNLIYNHQNRGEVALFGKGFKLSYYTKLEYISSSEIRLTTADGSVDTYKASGGYFRNQETHLKINRRNTYDGKTGSLIYYYDISDEAGNVVTYKDPSLTYPSQIKPISNENVYLDLESSVLSIKNDNGDTISFTRGNYGYVGTIEWKHKDASRLTATLSYVNSQLTSIVVKNSSTTANALVADYSLSITDSMIEVKDNMTGATTKFTLDGNKVTKIEEGFNGKYSDALITTIQYSDTRTTITNPHQKASTIVYDKEGLTRLVKDDKENFVAYAYDMETKALLAETPLPKPNRANNLLKEKSISNFTLNGSISLAKDHENIDVFYQVHAGSKSSYLYGNSSANYRVYENFLPTDTITLIIWAKQTMPCVPGSVSCFAQLTSGNRYSNSYFNKTKTDNEYFPFVMGFTFTEAASYIDILISFSGYFGLEIGSIELYKRSFGAFYQYDSEGNVISSSVSGNENKYSYANGVASGKESWTSHGVKYKRDSRQRITEAIGAYQTKQSLTYTTKNQVKTSKTENFNSSAIFESSSEYEEDDKKVTFIDELGNTSKEERDNFLNAIKTTNQVNQILKSTLNDSFELENLELLVGTTQHLNASYTYDSSHHNLVKTITMKNGMKYSFTYDEKDRVTSISLNDILLVSYTYDKYNQILTLKYGNSSEGVTFTYTDYEQIKTIKIGEITYTYYYNDLGNLECVSDGTSSWTYSYNEDNKVESLVFMDSDQEQLGIRYSYDNLGNVNKEREFIFGSEHVKEYEGLYRSNGCNAEKLASELQERSDFLSCMFIGNDVCLRKKNSTIKPLLNGTEVETTTTIMDEAIPCISVGKNTFKYKFNNAISYTGSFGFWYKFSYYPNSPTLLRIGNTSQYINLYIDSNQKLAVQVKDSTGSVSTIYTSTFAAGTGGWHFLGINWYCDSKTTSFMLIFDGEIDTFSAAKNIRISSPEYTMFYDVNGEVSGVIAGDNQQVSVNQFILFYRSSFDYVFNKVKQNNALDYSCTTHYLAPGVFTLYPLHHDLKSLNGMPPYKYGLRNVIVADTDRTFNYNSAIERYAYVADGAELEYKLQKINSGTIGLRAYIHSIKKQKQYLFELHDGQNTIGLFIDEDGKLRIECLGQSVKTNLSFRTGRWQFIGFTYNQTISSDSISLNYIALRLVVDESEFTTTIGSGRSVSSLCCSVGRKRNVTTISTSFGSYEETYPLHGQIEMLSINENYSSLATLTALKSNLELFNKTTGYNEFGMLTSSVITANQKDIMRKTLTYKSKTNSPKNKCLDIASEDNFFYGKGIITREYKTDNLGRLTKVTDTLFGNYFYSYDDKGYLASAGPTAEKKDQTEFTYDANGNITQAGTKEYEYSGTIKDRLTKALGEEVKYSDKDNPGNPTDWNGRTYTWDHSRRLSELKYNNVTTTYRYSADGLRIGKTHQGVTTNYLYSGNKLILEDNPSYELNFLYDENGLLYGFIKNSAKYFYIRDVYQNILGIIDNTGAIVVKYSYDAWGNHKVLDGNGNVNTSTSFIGNINPFRYKGYYYDKESNMYYCKSRYYVPEWCRWLNADSIGFLNPQNIHELNLFAYCKNNPVMYVDPSGHIAFFIVTAIIGAVIGFGIAAYNDYKVDGIWFNGDVGSYIGYTLGGMAIGAVVGFMTSSLLAGNFLANCGQVYAGLHGLAWAYTMGGSGAAGLYMANNFLNSIHVNSSWLGYLPSNNGFCGSTETITLQKDTIIQRIGGTGGTFAAPYYTDPMSLSLPYHQMKYMGTPTMYVVNQPITVTAGQAAPWFGQYGGGTQYLLPNTIQELLDLDILSKF